MSGDLERRYRRVLRILPGYYRQQWEEDMVTAFLESSLTGDPEEDEFVTEYSPPGITGCLIPTGAKFSKPISQNGIVPTLVGSALVVVTAGCYPDLVLDDLADKAVLVGDAA